MSEEDKDLLRFFTFDVIAAMIAGMLISAALPVSAFSCGLASIGMFIFVKTIQEKL